MQLKVKCSTDERLETLVKSENKTVLENIRSKQNEEFQASEGLSGLSVMQLKNAEFLATRFILEVSRVMHISKLTLKYFIFYS